MGCRREWSRVIFISIRLSFKKNEQSGGQNVVAGSGMAKAWFQPYGTIEVLVDLIQRLAAPRCWAVKSTPKLEGSSISDQVG